MIENQPIAEEEGTTDPLNGFDDDQLSRLGVDLSIVKVQPKSSEWITVVDSLGGYTTDEIYSSEIFRQQYENQWRGPSSTVLDRELSSIERAFEQARQRRRELLLDIEGVYGIDITEMVERLGLE